MLLRGLKLQRFNRIRLVNWCVSTHGLRQLHSDLKYTVYLSKSITSEHATLFKWSARCLHTYGYCLSPVNNSSQSDISDSTKTEHDNTQKPKINLDLVHIVTSLEQKQNQSYLYQHFSNILPHNDALFAGITSDLECFLQCLPNLLQPDIQPCTPEKSLQFSKTRRLSYNVDIESAFVILLQSLVMAVNPSYNNEFVKKLLDQFLKAQEAPVKVYISPDTFKGNFFNATQSRILSKNQKFLTALQLLKVQIEEEMRWKDHGSFGHDVSSWISSLFEASLTKCISDLNGCDVIPDIILYDVLLRKPQNELEYIAIYKLYAKHFESINFKDQELLYSLKQFANNPDKAMQRKLKIPVVFSNLLCYAARFRVTVLPKLITCFLDENNTRTPQIMEQLGEVMWILSYDQTGRNSILPSDFYRLAQSKIIKVLNLFISHDKNFDLNCTTLLAVSNLTYFHNFKKAYKYFKSAQKRFERWQLESFDIDGLEKAVRASQKYPDNSSPNKIMQLRYQRIDCNVKFLCNSILLLDIHKGNKKEMFNDFYCILKNTDPSLLKVYPEIWDIIFIKLNHHSMLDANAIGVLALLYLQMFDGHIYNNIVFDLIISHTENPMTLLQIYTKFHSEEMDESTLSKFISKLYKFAQNSGTMNTVQQLPLHGCNTSKYSKNIEHLLKNSSTVASFDYLIKHYQDVVIPEKMAKTRNEFYQPEEFRISGFRTPLEFARYLYHNATFKTSRLNSSYLLGESTLDPKNAFARYEALNAYTKVTPLTISSLFIAVLTMQKSRKYSGVTWTDSGGTENKKPVDVVFEEFDKRISDSLEDCVTGKFYPNDNLLVLYLQCAKKFGKSDKLYSFLKSMVDLRYPMKSGLFHTYISMLPAADRAELTYALDAYDKRFRAFRKCSSEYELDQMKSTVKPIRVTGRFADFVSNLDFTWGIVGKWDWPGR